MMMLFYKSWKEIQTRLAVSVVAMILYCAFAVRFPLPNAHADNAEFQRWISDEVLANTGKIVFLLGVIFFALGGLLRERERNSAIFTLVLPVSRTELIWTEIVTGIGAMAVLAFLPVLLLPAFSALVHHSYPAELAARYCILRFFCGTFIFANTFLTSTVVRGGYAAAITGFLALFLEVMAINRSPLIQYGMNPMATMSGRWVVGSTINDPFRWNTLGAFVLLACALLSIAVLLTKREDL